MPNVEVPYEDLVTVIVVVPSLEVPEEDPWEVDRMVVDPYACRWEEGKVDCLEVEASGRQVALRSM